jgi:hypothetical protein
MLAINEMQDPTIRPFSIGSYLLKDSMKDNCNENFEGPCLAHHQWIMFGIFP